MRTNHHAPLLFATGLCFAQFAHESKIGAKIGTPRDSRPYTTVRVTLGLEMIKMAGIIIQRMELLARVAIL